MSQPPSPMLTQCPHCHTLFRIRGEQLRAADGQARCCRCSRVFDALAHLRDEEPAAPRRGTPPRRSAYALRPSALEPPASEVPRRPRPERSEPGPAVVGAAVESAPTPAPDRTPAQPGDTPSQAGPGDAQTGPPELESGHVAEPAFRVEPGTALEAADEDTEPRFCAPFTDEADDTPFEMPEGLPEIEPSQATPPPDWTEEGDAAPSPSIWSRLGWGLGALLLLCGALIQLLWWDRDALAQTVQGRRFVEPFCAAVGCEVAPRRALERIRVLSRDVSPHPTQSQALLIMLVMVNEATFAQPFPLLQLTLYDDQEQPVGQRRFTPQEYLGDAQIPPMKPDQAVYVRLELVDPGRAVTGFRFDFL